MPNSVIFYYLCYCLLNSIIFYLSPIFYLSLLSYTYLCYLLLISVIFYLFMLSYTYLCYLIRISVILYLSLIFVTLYLIQLTSVSLTAASDNTQCCI